MLEKIKKRESGITLIVLVVTIIILLILSGVVIALLTGENGILKKSTKAANETEKQTAAEIINLKITNVQIDTYAQKQRTPTLKELSLALKEDEEIQYITESSKIASVEYSVNSDNPSKIYTKLKEYPYEFEINSSLQLASIDGKKIASIPTNDDDTIVSMTKKELKDLINSEVTSQLRNVVQEKLQVNTVSTSNITYNTNYIDASSDATWVHIKKYGNVVMLNYSLKIKSDIPNSQTILFSGIPEASADVHFQSLSTYADVFSVRSKIIGADVQLFWAGKTISTQNNHNTLEGGVVYISNN